nr:hypothetical protein Itr_chr02CG13020 [Ipomoea trifida]
MCETAMPPRTIQASTKSKLGITASSHNTYKDTKGQTSKRHSRCLFLSKSTVSTTFPPTRNLVISAAVDNLSLCIGTHRNAFSGEEKESNLIRRGVLSKGRSNARKGHIWLIMEFLERKL